MQCITKGSCKYSFLMFAIFHWELTIVCIAVLSPKIKWWKLQGFFIAWNFGWMWLVCQACWSRLPACLPACCRILAVAHQPPTIAEPWSCAERNILLYVVLSGDNMLRVCLANILLASHTNIWSFGDFCLYSQKAIYYSFDFRMPCISWKPRGWTMFRILTVYFTL